jgi:hypothetical protein
MRLGKSPRCQSCTSALVSGAASGLRLVSSRAILQVMHVSDEINYGSILSFPSRYSRDVLMNFILRHLG